jgi:penicillin-binding protein 1A
MGYSPCMQVNNVPDTITGIWQRHGAPRSSPSETIPGLLRLRQALAHSQNWVTAHVMNEVKAGSL